MPQTENKKVKLATLRYGKGCMITIYVCTSVLVFMGLVMLLFNNYIGFAPLGIALFVFVPIIVVMHFHNAGNSVTFVDGKIQSRRRTLTWDSAYLTVHCHKMLDSRTVFVWLYFDDHYLTAKEIRSWRVSRQGLVLRLDSIEKAQFILSHCKYKIEVFGEDMFHAHYLEILSTIYMYNSRFE